MLTLWVEYRRNCATKHRVTIEGMASPDETIEAARDLRQHILKIGREFQDEFPLRSGFGTEVEMQPNWSYVDADSAFYPEGMHFMYRFGLGREDWLDKRTPHIREDEMDRVRAFFTARDVPIKEREN